MLFRWALYGVLSICSLSLGAQGLPAPDMGDATTTQHFYRLRGAKAQEGQVAHNYVLSGLCSQRWGGHGHTTDDFKLQVSVLPKHDNVSGVVAQAIGSSGTDGGSNKNPACIGFAGGDGGDGGDGGAITVQYSAESQAEPVRFQGAGIVVESLGGNGGAGGRTHQAGPGGQGGQGGQGRRVDVSNDVAMLTQSPGAYGIWARSAGGWGGEGGGASFWMPTATKGGSGAMGASGGSVRVDNHARIHSAQSIPIFVQSMGGQGGRGGRGGSAWVGIDHTINGSGGYGGPGGPVQVENEGNLSSSMPGGYGLLAQSIGGGGGAAGSRAALLGLGAMGGLAASADKVIAHNHEGADITTGGVSASGIHAQSVGGGGGSGGLAVGRVALGGVAGEGGHGGAVQASNRGTIMTGGACRTLTEQGKCSEFDSTAMRHPSNGAAFGMLVQSVGGGGGSGGMGLSGNLGLPSISLGGLGGGGGHGGAVHAANSGLIVTVEPNSAGLLAQSVGGGGGTGGGAIAVNASFILSLGASDGGHGGPGGAGGSVAVNCPSDIAALECAKAGDALLRPLAYANTDQMTGIVTSGVGSPGILAQSVGGGGGHGGFALNMAGSETAAVSVALGGSGGKGGAGAGVYASAAGVPITTYGVESHGIAALSTGGGGGQGSYAIAGAVAGDLALTTAVGGTGGAGGAAGPVQLLNKQRPGWKVSPITTHGARSHGMLAQSIGGGGGSAGGSIDALVSGVIGLGLSLGGQGGIGQSGAAVTLDNDADIRIDGSAASALTAQSIGGGGGQGGYAIAADAALTLAADVVIGGRGGSGAVAGPVHVNNAGRLTSRAGGAAAVLAQSIGGGGGHGGIATNAALSLGAAGGFGVGGHGGLGSSAGAVTLNNSAAIVSTSSTEDALGLGQGNNPGLVAQSIAGGGGFGAYSVGALVAEQSAQFTVGGSGGSAGKSGPVSVTSTATIATQGDLSPGVMAQSVAGAGGSAGMALTGQLSGSGLSTNIGGKGGGGGLSGTVTVQSTATVSTKGLRSDGILAQSIGGAGGRGGLVASAGLSQQVSLIASIGHGGGVAGRSQDVSVEHLADLNTQGAQSCGIVAQSIAGAGGVGGFALGSAASQGVAAWLELAGQAGTGGHSGDVTVKTLANSKITTRGEQSGAIVAQSIGGSGGQGGIAAAGVLSSSQVGLSVAGHGATGGTAGVSRVMNHAVLSTQGVLAPGILVQSIGGAGGRAGLNGLAAITQHAQANVSVAANGASGGRSQDVIVENQAMIDVQGAQSSAVVAQSIGGAGGQGGMHLAAGLSAGGAAELNIGGRGGVGGQSGPVSLINAAPLSAKGAQALTVLLQSIGGSGGNGGHSLMAAGGLENYYGVTLGGGSGRASHGQRVYFENHASLLSEGDGAGAVLAQSIGGSGGRGGQTVSGSVANELTSSVRLGSDGADGGAASEVKVHLLRSPQGPYVIASQGDLSSAIVAQSLGGHGGSGGFVGSLAVARQSVALSTLIGGAGGQAGSAGDVSIKTDTGVAIHTQGQGSSAVVAQSIAGSGGNGGSVVSGGLTLGTTRGPVSLTIGGAAGKAGHAKSVNLALQQTSIVTQGRNALGVVAQSIAGDGGLGSQSRDYSVGHLGSNQTMAASLVVGGAGGRGGQAGSVKINHSGDITTSGSRSLTDGSIALLAQSIGGSGGYGGQAISHALAGQSSLSLAVGGHAGSGDYSAGGHADQVSVVSNWNDDGAIRTTGSNASGVVAQSIGGGGGAGGWSQSQATSQAFGLGLAVGGWGGHAGRAGAVDVLLGGHIDVAGAHAKALIAQSIGGGGGMGAAAVAQGVAKPGAATQAASAAVGRALNALGFNPRASSFLSTRWVGHVFPQAQQEVPEQGGAFSVAVGGAGGQGGQASDVSVESQAIVTTAGHHGHGLLAQSVGGGGGEGGSSRSHTDARQFSAALSVGGFGRQGAWSGRVMVKNHGAITTLAEQAKGIVAQSVGGGGGMGAASTVNSHASEQTLIAVSLGVGGWAGKGGSSGAQRDMNVVDVLNTAPIRTHGAYAHGIDAQSIGAGGGDAGTSSVSTRSAASEPEQKNQTLNTSVVADLLASARTGLAPLSPENSPGSEVRSDQGARSGDTTDAQNGSQAQAQVGTSVGLTVGGYGGDGGFSNHVSVTNHAPIVTGAHDDGVPSAGDHAMAIAAQSVGGGGGQAVAVNSHADGRQNSVSMVLGGYGGRGGDSGHIQVNNQARLQTSGHSATALFAQSVAGGGGYGGAASLNSETEGPYAAAIALGGRAGAAGHAGQVQVRHGSAGLADTGIVTMGALSPGIFAQSVGGGGGHAGAVLTASQTRGVAVSQPVHASDDSALLESPLQNDVVQQTLRLEDVPHVSEVSTSQLNQLSEISEPVPSEESSQNALAATHETTGTLVQVTDEGDALAQAKQGVAVVAVLGARAGAGGHGAAVTVHSHAPIHTQGAASIGIYAQSLGGGGGQSGAVVAQSQQRADTLLFALGARGGSGGSGSTVDVQSEAPILTHGPDAIGILAQSIGGGGGHSLAVTTSEQHGQGDRALALALGANGGLGHQSGAVQVRQRGAIQTYGDHAAGVVAQSIAGGGGSAQSVQSGSGSAKTDVALALGGSGGSAAASGDVRVLVDSSIQTQGQQANAIFAQSVAGGGGLGASARTQSQQQSLLVATMTLGGAGGHGGRAGSVWVSTLSEDMQGGEFARDHASSLSEPKQLRTRGHQAGGIVAQSVGGGGGTAGDTQSELPPNKNLSSPEFQANSLQSFQRLAFTLGGRGASGADGGAVQVKSAHAISTAGDDAPAMMAQSIGGGGGRGSSVSHNSHGSSTSRQWTLGAKGGDGGSAAAVSVTSLAALATRGVNASAVIAQSVGGGGGWAASTDRALTGRYESAIEQWLGAHDGASGGAQGVTAIVRGAIHTQGDNASGIVAQSLAGGGGLTTFSQSTLENEQRFQSNLGSVAKQTTRLQQARRSGDVAVELDAPIHTQGANAIGVFAQSVSGGGGVSLAHFSAERVGLQASHLGGLGEAQSVQGDHAGDVVVQQRAAIRTEGAAAVGLLAQSVAGGGGYLSIVNRRLNSSITQGALTLGGGASVTKNALDAGTVQVTVDAPIVTVGESAVGVLAQSVGGGGGAVVTHGVGHWQPQFVAGDGHGANVTVNVNAPVTVHGAGAYGVVAQSVGGGGGLLLSEQGLVVGSGGGEGAAGIVAVHVNASVIASGGGTAIYAGSAQGDSDPSVIIAPGVLVGATSGAAAVVLEGQENELINAGTIAVDDPDSAPAIELKSPLGHSVLKNSGVIRGRIVNLGDMEVINSAGATLRTGTDFDLGEHGRLMNQGDLYVTHVQGADSVLENHGVLSVGSFETTDILELEGGLQQTAGGQLHLSIDSENQLQPTDTLMVAQQARLDGEIVPHVKSLLPGKYRWVQAASLQSRLTPRDSALFDWSAETVDQQLVGTVSSRLTSASHGLDAQQHVVAQYLTQIWRQKDVRMARLFGYLHGFQVGQTDAYRQLLTQIAGQAIHAQAQEMKLLSVSALDDSMACKQLGRGKTQVADCAWMSVSNRLAEQSAISGFSGYRATSHGLRLGVQRSDTKHWTRGLALAYLQNNVKAIGLSSQGRFVSASLGLQKRVGDWVFGAAVAYTQGWVSQQRTIDLPRLSEFPEPSWRTPHRYDSQVRLSNVGLRFRAAYDHTIQDYYIKPAFDVDVLYRLSSAYRELGAPLALQARRSQQWDVMLTPSIEVGKRFLVKNKYRYKAYGRLGASLMMNPQASRLMSLAQASDQSITFPVVAQSPAVLGRLTLGVQTMAAENLELSAQYSLLFSSGYASQNLELDLTYHF